MNTKKDYLVWLSICLPIVIIVPLLFFVCISMFCRGTWVNGVSNIAFHIGSLEVAWYGIFIFLGFVLSILLACIKLWKIYKCAIDPFYWFCLMGIPLAIVGARFGSCAIGQTPWSGFFTNFGAGLAIEWGVMLVVLVALIYFPLVLRSPKYQIRDLTTEPNKVRQVSMWVYVDAIVPAILLGQILGRYGNYMNQEVYGLTINGGWAHFVENLFPYMQTSDGVKQPLFLIESFINFWGLIFIYFGCEFIKNRKCGDLGLLYFLWYGIVRSALEPLRDSQYSNFGNTVAVSTIISALWIIVAIVLLIMNHTVFIKLRNYKLKSTFKNRLYLLLFFNLTLRSLDNNRDQVIECNKQITMTQDVNEKQIIKEKLEKINGKINYLNDRVNKLNQIKNNLKINFFRTDDEKLYYLGR